MTKATLPGRFNANGGERVNTLMHRCTLLDEDVSYPIEDLRQGRDCTTPVPKFSMLAGKPDQDDVDDLDVDMRTTFWQSYAATVALVILCVVILSNWPN